jgi:hypothetical protein
MTGVPSFADGTLIGVEQVWPLHARTFFQFRNDYLSVLPGMPGYFGTVQAVAPGGLGRFSP